MLMEEDSFGNFDDSEESKRDFASDLLSSSAPSRAASKAESRKNMLLQQRQQALQRQSSRRRQSSGAIESNKGFVEVNTRTIGPKRNSARFSIPKSIDPLQGEHGPSLAFKSKDYAKSYKGGYQAKEYGTVLSSEDDYVAPAKGYKKSDLVLEEEPEQPMYDVQEEFSPEERDDDTSSNLSDTNSNQSARSNQASAQQNYELKTGWKKPNKQASRRSVEEKGEEHVHDRSYFSESKEDRESSRKSRVKHQGDTAKASKAAIKADMKKRGISQSYDPNPSPVPSKSDSRKASVTKSRRPSSKPKLPKKPLAAETSEEEKRITDDELQEEQKESGESEEDSPVSRRRARQNNSRTKDKGQNAVEIDLSNMYEFLVNTCPQKYGSVQCYIERHKGNLKLSPEYYLYLKQGDRFLMGSKKRAGKATANYIITMDQKLFSKTSPSYLGKLRSNFLGTEFQIFDKGINPKNNDQDALHSKNNTVREELGCVIYASNVLGSRGPRKMKVAVPALKKDGNRKVFRPTKKADELLSRFKDRDMNDVIELINKPPRWNDQVGAYVLNFNGRVTMASVKNFQLVSPEDEDKIILQFGRVGKDLFTMDFSYPLTPFQAFAICLSSLDGKWACE